MAWCLCVLLSVAHSVHLAIFPELYYSQLVALAYLPV